MSGGPNGAPAFQFYPAAWRFNVNLLRCSWAARGVWIAVLGVLWENGETAGIVRFPLADIARLVHCDMALLEELVERNVLKGCDVGHFPGFTFTPYHARRHWPPRTLIEPCDGPIWFSSRMVVDVYRRKQRGKGTRFGDVTREQRLRAAVAQRAGDLGAPA